MAKTRKVVTKEDVIRQDKKRAERLAKKKTEEENIVSVNEIDNVILPIVDDEIIEENVQVSKLDEENNTEENELVTLENNTVIDSVPENWSDIFNTNAPETEIPEKKVMPIRYVNVVMGKYLD